MTDSNITTENKKEIQIFREKDTLWTTSINVAERFGKRHTYVLEVIDKLLNSSQDTQPEFRLSEYKDSSGRVLKMYNVSKEGFSLLAMGFTGKKALQWKLQYIKAFKFLEKQYFKVKERQLNLDWKRDREEGKISRRKETDAIKEFVAYAKEQGSRSADKYYMIITKVTYKILYDLDGSVPRPEKIRDNLDFEQLSNLKTAENMLDRVIRQEIKVGTYYKDIYQTCKQKLEALASVVGVIPFMAVHQQIDNQQSLLLN